MSKYQWKNRVLLIFTPSASDARFTGQMEALEQRKTDVHDRDIVVLPVVGAVEPRLRSQFRVGVHDFRTILVGKDSNEKHRWSNIAPVDQINHRIDRMPMRRVEMRTGGTTSPTRRAS